MTLDLKTIETTKQEIASWHAAGDDPAELFRLKFLSKKGIINQLFDAFKGVAPDERKLLGKPLNELKQAAQQKWDELKLQTKETLSASMVNEDATLPGIAFGMGSVHPLTQVQHRIISIFQRMGFSLSSGPEVEDDWHNFTALNFPPDHPARDMQDTFFVNLPGGEWALRTHTSGVQIRVMEQQKPPIRTISPGRVYRNEAISARAHCFFHQVEALYVDKEVSFAQLKQTLLLFCNELFGTDTQIRLRPSYFPFTEPSAEMDISCTVCRGKGCNICKQTGWVEILGCGMVDPQVLQNCGIDPETYSGFALGMGIERIAMLLYRIDDLRHFSQNDFRFLQQFPLGI